MNSVAAYAEQHIRVLYYCDKEDCVVLFITARNHDVYFSIRLKILIVTVYNEQG